MGKKNKDGSVSLLGTSVGTSGESYVVYLDYIKYTTFKMGHMPKDMNNLIRRAKPTFMKYADTYEKVLLRKLSIRKGTGETTDSKEAKKGTGGPTSQEDSQATLAGAVETLCDWLTTTGLPVNIYWGIGVRVVADVTVLSGSVDLSSIYGLGFAAKEKKICGTMVIQTLGISGESITPLVPFPSEINVTAIQNALTAVAAIRVKLYESSESKKVCIAPQVVGYEGAFDRYSPVFAEAVRVLILFADPSEFELPEDIRPWGGEFAVSGTNGVKVSQSVLP